LKGITWILFVYLITMIVAATVIITGCTSGPISTINTSSTTTTPLLLSTTTSPTTTTAMTPATTLITTTTTSTVPDDVPNTYQILDLIVPDAQVEGVFNILVVIANNINSQSSYDIPLKLWRVEDPANVRTYVISITLNANETKEVSSEDIYVPNGSYVAEVDDIIKSIEVG